MVSLCLKNRAASAGNTPSSTVVQKEAKKRRADAVMASLIQGAPSLLGFLPFAHAFELFKMGSGT